MAHPLFLEASRRKFLAERATRAAIAKQCQAESAAKEASAKENFAVSLAEDARIQQSLAARTAWEASMWHSRAYHLETLAQERSNVLFLKERSASNFLDLSRLSLFLEGNAEAWRSGELYGSLDAAKYEACKAKHDAYVDTQAADSATNLAHLQAQGAQAAQCMANSWALEARKAREFAKHHAQEASRAKQLAESQVRDAHIAHHFALQHVHERAAMDFNLQIAEESNEHIFTPIDQYLHRNHLEPFCQRYTESDAILHHANLEQEPFRYAGLVSLDPTTHPSESLANLEPFRYAGLVSLDPLDPMTHPLDSSARLAGHGPLEQDLKRNMI